MTFQSYGERIAPPLFFSAMQCNTRHHQVRSHEPALLRDQGSHPDRTRVIKLVLWLDQGSPRAVIHSPTATTSSAPLAILLQHLRQVALRRLSEWLEQVFLL